MSNQEIIDKHLAEFHETHGLKVPIELHSYLHRMLEESRKTPKSIRKIFDFGAKVKIKNDWRYWKKGDRAVVKSYDFERGLGGLQLLILEAETNKKAEKDSNCLYAYAVELIEQ